MVKVKAIHLETLKDSLTPMAINSAILMAILMDSQKETRKLTGLMTVIRLGFLTVIPKQTATSSDSLKDSRMAIPMAIRNPMVIDLAIRTDSRLATRKHLGLMMVTRMETQMEILKVILKVIHLRLVIMTDSRKATRSDFQKPKEISSDFPKVILMDSRKATHSHF